MTNDLRDLLDDVADGPASGVRVDAHAAWTDGLRRRVRRRVRTGVIGVAALTAVTIAAPLARDLAVAPGFADQPGAHAQHYPQRLEHDYIGTTMPKVTGPLAGIVRRSDEDLHGWYAVSPGGRMWRIDDAQGDVVPSRDGRHLAYLRGATYASALFAITDQITGEVTTFDDVSLGVTYKGVPATDATYFHSDQTPLFWNAAGSAVLGQLGTVTGRTDGVAAGVFSVDGSLTVIRNSTSLEEGSHPIGWFDDDTAAFVSSVRGQPRVSAVDVDTSRIVRSFPLRGVQPDFVSQWYASLSPDGTAVMTLGDGGDDLNEPTVRVHSAQRGIRDATMPTPDGLNGYCQPTWTANDAYLPVSSEQREDSAVLARANGGAPIVADPRLHVTCSVWAASALEGGPDPSIGDWLFGTGSSWLSWHWRELVLGALAGAAAAAAAFFQARRRRS